MGKAPNPFKLAFLQPPRSAQAHPLLFGLKLKIWVVGEAVSDVAHRSTHYTVWSTTLAKSLHWFWNEYRVVSGCRIFTVFSF